jgi:hypothetical protein
MSDLKKEVQDLVLPVIAIVISILAAIFTGLQWNEARNTRIEVHRDAEKALERSESQFKTQRDDAQAASVDQQVQVNRSATAANRSATAAEVSATTSKAALEVSERAYIGITALGMDKDFADGQETRITAVIANSGRTPAFNVRTRHYFNCAPKPIPDVLPFTKVETISTAVVHPLVQLTQASDKVPPLSREIVEMIRKGSWAFVAYGIVEYTDAFHKKRSTRYCYMYDPMNPTLFQVCTSGNEAN